MYYVLRFESRTFWEASLDTFLELKKLPPDDH